MASAVGSISSRGISNELCAPAIALLAKNRLGKRLRKAGVVVVVVVDGVVQAQRTDARAVALVADHIQFTVQLEAVGDQAGAEVLVAIVEVRIGQQFAVALVGAEGCRITQGIGEVDLHAIAHFPTERRKAGRRQHRGGKENSSQSSV
ncbi:hypothetical protein D3C85_1034060 [compost metagenome]